MDRFKEYYITHKNLDTGWHSFTFKLEQQFFDLFDYHSLTYPNFNVVLDIDKSNDSLRIIANVDGSYKAACDRCLKNVPIDIKASHTQFIRYSDEEREEEDIIFITPLAHRINVAKILFDNILLSMPILNKRNCEAENYLYCDKKMLTKIEDLTKIQEEKDKTSSENSVWDALKNLNINN